MKRAHSSPREYRVGFTLIELLVVTVIVSLTVGAIGACLAAGIRIFEASRSLGRAESEVQLALIGMERDLRNSAPYADMSLRGEVSTLSFARAIPVRDDQGRLFYSTRLVTYRFEAERRRLVRSQAPYSPVERPPSQQADVVLSSVRDAHFEYLDDAERPLWKGEWNSSSNRPAAIRVSIILDVASGVSRWQRLVALPALEPIASEDEEGGRP